MSNLEKFLEKRVKQAQDSLVIQNFTDTIPNSCRVEITEVDEFDSETLGIKEASK